MDGGDGEEDEVRLLFFFFFFFCPGPLLVSDDELVSLDWDRAGLPFFFLLFSGDELRLLDRDRAGFPFFFLSVSGDDEKRSFDFDRAGLVFFLVFSGDELRSLDRDLDLDRAGLPFFFFSMALRRFTFGRSFHDDVPLTNDTCLVSGVLFITSPGFACVVCPATARQHQLPTCACAY